MDDQPTMTRYRIMLAGSVALFFHAMLVGVMALSFDLPEPARTVTFELVNAGQGAVNSSPAPAATASQAAQPARVPAPSPIQTAIEEQIRALTDRPAPRMAEKTPVQPVTEQASQEEQVETGLRVPVKSPRQDVPPSPLISAFSDQSSPSASAMAGVPTPFKAPPSDAPMPAIKTEDKPRISAYQLLLSRQLMNALQQEVLVGSTGERYARELSAGPKPLSLRLKLMSNGTLQRVTVTHSSGNKFVDRVMVQSALAASPYPSPPAESHTNGFRFDLDLIASPTYL